MGALVNRVLVAVPLAIVVLGALYAGGAALVVLGMAAGLLALHEFFGMTRRHRPIVITGQLGAAAMIAGAYWGGVGWALLPIPVVLLLTFLLAAAVSMRESATVSIALTVLGACYVGLGIAFLVLLREIGDDRIGFNIVLAVFLGVWGSDIFAYFGGRAYGRRKLAPAISPGKTVEGALTGLVFGTAAVWFTLYGQEGIDPVDGLLVGLAVAVVSPLGDLFESFLKRDLGVKDSGRLLGEHGGMLDRIDALLLAGPVAYLVFDVLGRT